MEIFQNGEMENEMQKRELQASNLSMWWKLFTDSYEELIHSITSPVRAQYTLPELGAESFDLFCHGKTVEFVREDFQLSNPRNQVLQCSFWRSKESCIANPIQPEQCTGTTMSKVVSNSFSLKAAPCIIYLHGMSSSRKECVYLHRKVLTAGFSLLALDFSGAGMSEGDRVSFGFFERDDLRVVLDYLYATDKASSVGIWGRDIGGATALLHLRDTIGYQYKTLRLSKHEAMQLHIVECKHTQQLLCQRPSSIGLPFRMTRIDVQNGDFVLLAINNVPVKGLSVKECIKLIQQNADGCIRIAGYSQTQGAVGMDKFVVGVTVDSTYGDMEQVIWDMLTEVSASAQRRDLNFPAAMLTAAASIIGNSIRKTGGYHLRDVKLLDDAPRMVVPCLFVCGSKKDFFTPAHTITLYEQYGGPKKLLQFTGQHDNNRPEHVVDAVIEYFIERFKLL